MCKRLQFLSLQCYDDAEFPCQRKLNEPLVNCNENLPVTIIMLFINCFLFIQTKSIQEYNQSYGWKSFRKLIISLFIVPFKQTPPAYASSATSAFYEIICFHSFSYQTTVSLKSARVRQSKIYHETCYVVETTY